VESEVGNRPERRRVRVRRKRTRWERFVKFIEMPHLKRRDRNQRLAIVAVVALMIVYLGILRPLYVALFPEAPAKKPQSGTGLQKKR